MLLLVMFCSSLICWLCLINDMFLVLLLFSLHIDRVYHFSGEHTFFHGGDVFHVISLYWSMNR